jgi:aspartate-semialdehyde dehydrogenase
MRDENIFHGIHRGLEHISVVACISASGDHMMPFVVSSQISDAVVWKFKIEGFRTGTEIILQKREKPYMNPELFHEHIPTILLPHIAKLRSNLGATDELAVLLIEKCSVHKQESTLRDIAAP